MTKTTIDQAYRLDIVAQMTMGTEQNGCVEALLAANPGLGAGGPYIAEGATIEIPATPSVPAASVVNPWD